MLVRILGGIDLLSSFAFLMLIFGMTPAVQFVLFCAGLLLLKSMFIFNGEPLSAVDLISSIVLIFSIFLPVASVLLWIPAFLLLAKGVVSFL